MKNLMKKFNISTKKKKKTNKNQEEKIDENHLRVTADNHLAQF